VAAVRWLDLRFEPIIESIPSELLNRLEAAEIFHQLLEHRWYMAEQAAREVSLEEALADYVALLAGAPAERLQLDDKRLVEGGDLTGEIAIVADDDDIRAVPGAADTV
jgi:hypothetical protein